MKKLIGEGCCSKKKGFTLIELLIVVAIIGLLATLAIVSLTTAQSKARDTKRISDIKSLQNAVEMYYNDNNVYPTPADWTALRTTLTAGTVSYLTAIPAPPGSGVTGDQYTYRYNTGATAGQDYCLITKLERDNQILDQSVVTDNCGVTTGTSISSGTATSSCAVATFNLCLGN